MSIQTCQQIITAARNGWSVLQQERLILKFHRTKIICNENSLSDSVKNRSLRTLLTSSLHEGNSVSVTPKRCPVRAEVCEPASEAPPCSTFPGLRGRRGEK